MQYIFNHRLLVCEGWLLYSQGCMVKDIRHVAQVPLGEFLSGNKDEVVLYKNN